MRWKGTAPLGMVPVNVCQARAWFCWSGGPAQVQTARALRLLLREQLESELSRMTAPRVQAFVAYLRRNGVELVHGGGLGTWWVVGHGLRGGPLAVRIHAFSPVVSEGWMRQALASTSWAACSIKPSAICSTSDVGVMTAMSPMIRSI